MSVTGYWIVYLSEESADFWQDLKAKKLKRLKCGLKWSYGDKPFHRQKTGKV